MPGSEPPRRPSSRRPGQPGRGVSGHEREDLLNEPPEYQSSDRLDTIGLETDQGSQVPRSASGRRISSRRSGAGGISPSDRLKKQEWAQARLKNLKAIGWAAAGVAVLGVACYIPVFIRNGRLSALRSAKPAERMQAAVNLGELRSGLDQVAGILRGCQTPEDFAGRGGAAALALALAGGEGFSRLQAFSEEKDNPVARLCAVYGLGLTRNPEAAGPLAARLADNDTAVKIQAARSLGMIRSPEAVRALVGQAQGLAEVREAAVEGIFSICCSASPDQIPNRDAIKDELVKGLGAPTPKMRQACGRALIMIDRVPSDPELLERTASDDPAVRAAAVEFIGLIGGKLFDVVIPKALEDKAPEVRAAAASAVGLRRWAPGAEAVEKLVASAAEPLEVRQAAAEALGAVGRLESVVPLARALTMDTTERADGVRLAAAASLSAIGKANHPRRLTAPKENNDLLTHLKLSARTPDPRWAALEILVAGCGDFGAKVGPEAFQAMNDLAWRKRVPKAEEWKEWMAKKSEEARSLGLLSKRFEEAYAACVSARGTMTAEAAALFNECAGIFEQLKTGCRDEDKWFYDELQKLLESNLKLAAEFKPPAKPAEQAPAEPNQ